MHADAASQREWSDERRREAGDERATEDRGHRPEMLASMVREDLGESAQSFRLALHCTSLMPRRARNVSAGV